MTLLFSRALALCSLTQACLLTNAVAMAQQAPATTDGPVQTPGLGGAAAATGAAGAPGWINLAMIGGMIFFMWLFIIRPQAKRQKEHKAFLDTLKTGQEVITSGGLIGKVQSVSDTIVTVDLGNGSVRVLKSAISGELGGSQALSPSVSST